MPKAFCYLDEHTIEKLQEMANKANQSFSKSMRDIVLLGLQVHEMQEKNDGSTKEKEAELTSKHTEYLLRILNIVGEIYHCSFDKERLSHPSESPEESLAKIRDKVQTYLDGYLQKDQ